MVHICNAILPSHKKNEIMPFAAMWMELEIISKSYLEKHILSTCVLVAQSCPQSLQPHGLGPTKLLCPWNSPGKNTGVGCHFLLQGIFLTQGSNPGLPCCRQILYHLSHQGNPNGILPSHKKNGIMPFIATWMELEIIILSEVRQRKTNMILLICGT